jgi:hypothetical protein
LTVTISAAIAAEAQKIADARAKDFREIRMMCVLLRRERFPFPGCGGAPAGKSRDLAAGNPRTLHAFIIRFFSGNA